MSTGDYIVHYNASVKLNSNVIDKINEILNSDEYINEKYKEKEVHNGWDALLYAIEIYSNHKVKLDKLKKKFPIININPDENKLKGCTVNCKKMG